jgi:hypothetical protein
MEAFFPPERDQVGQPAKTPTRTFLDALRQMTGEGARWRALPIISARRHCRDP